MNLRDLDISNPFKATLLSSERMTPPEADAEVKHLVFQAPVERDFTFSEGQSLGVLAPGSREFGNRFHFRLYSIASPRRGENGKPYTFSLCVRRCFYVDEISGERYPGKASNYLCDLHPGDQVPITGPYGAHFSVPEDDSANLLMIGVGTGIAPFRAFVRHIFEERGHWRGKVRLFYGARTGMELLYLNDVKRDFALYYNKESFKAFEALSPRPHFDVAPDLESAFHQNAEEIWNLVRDPGIAWIFLLAVWFGFLWIGMVCFASSFPRPRPRPHRLVLLLEYHSTPLQA